MAKSHEVLRRRFVVDAEGEILGRLATRVADVLRGKHRPIYTPHVNTGEHVVVINAAKIAVTGRKLQTKTYERYSGYPSGLRIRTLEEVMRRSPTEAIRHAVAGMLPKGPLGRDALRKLKVYAGPLRREFGQKLEPLPGRSSMRRG